MLQPFRTRQRLQTPSKITTSIMEDETLQQNGMTIPGMTL